MWNAENLKLAERGMRNASAEEIYPDQGCAECGIPQSPDQDTPWIIYQVFILHKVNTWKKTGVGVPRKEHMSKTAILCHDDKWGDNLWTNFSTCHNYGVSGIYISVNGEGESALSGREFLVPEDQINWIFQIAEGGRRKAEHADKSRNAEFIQKQRGCRMTQKHQKHLEQLVSMLTSNPQAEYGMRNAESKCIRTRTRLRNCSSNANVKCGTQKPSNAEFRLAMLSIENVWTKRDKVTCCSSFLYFAPSTMLDLYIFLLVVSI